MNQEVVANIEKLVTNMLTEVHTALPGTITAFDTAACTATVQPVGTIKCSNGVKSQYPVISNVPIVMPYSRSAAVGIAFPVAVGDSCLIIFSEAELDEWRTGAQSEGALRFDLTSAVAIPGMLASMPAAVSEAMNGAAVITAGSNKVKVSSGGITLSGNVTISGNVTVSGSVSASGSVTAPNID